MNIRDWIAVDIEADNLIDKVSKIWLITAIDNNGNKYLATDEDYKEKTHTIDEMLIFLSNRNNIFIHNGIGYDLPVLKKLKGWEPSGDVYDTFVLSQLLFPNELQTHGMKEIGKRYGLDKLEFKDFANFSAEMAIYGMRDTEILHRFVQSILKELNSYDWSRAVELEQKHYKYVIENGQYAVIDVPLLDRYIGLLERYVRLCKRALIKLAPKVLIKNEIEVKLRKKDGSLTKTALDYLLKTNSNPTNYIGNFCRVEWVELNLSSTQQVINWLLSIGWEPDTWNYKTDLLGKTVKGPDGNPVISSPSLSGSAYYGIPDNISSVLKRHSVAETRLSNLKGWKRAIFDGNKLIAWAYTCGASTGRYKHRLIVNIPKASDDVFFGKQMRSIFTVHDGYKMVGCDAAAVEARIEGHYISRYEGGPEYTKILLEGDIHKENAESWEVSRSDAKAPFYALSYGATAKKISEILRCDLAQATEIYQKYWTDRPFLKDLLADLNNSLVKRGQAEPRGPTIKITDKRAYIRGADGRKLFIRSPHSIKNTLIQGCGAILLKLAYNRLHEQIKENKLDARIIIAYHDEFQVEVKSDHAEIVRLIAEDAWEYAGKQLKLVTPIKGEGKIGNNWKETH